MIRRSVVEIVFKRNRLRILTLPFFSIFVCLLLFCLCYSYLLYYFFGHVGAVTYNWPRPRPSRRRSLYNPLISEGVSKNRVLSCLGSMFQLYRLLLTEYCSTVTVAHELCLCVDRNRLKSQVVTKCTICFKKQKSCVLYSWVSRGTESKQRLFP